jgi:hypothetical protein
MTKEKLLALAEIGTFLDGLKVAQGMTKAQIAKAIKIIQEDK